MELNERHQIKRKYGQYEAKHINSSAPIRDSIVTFVGKRFVTEDEIKSYLTQLSEERGSLVNGSSWFKNNTKYFESFTNRGQQVVTLSKYGKRVLEFIKQKDKETRINEGKNYDILVDVLTNSMEDMTVPDFAGQMKQAGLNPKTAKQMFEAYWDLDSKERLHNDSGDWEDFIAKYESVDTELDEAFNFLNRIHNTAAKEIVKTIKKQLPNLGSSAEELLFMIASDYKKQGEKGLDSYIK